MGVLDKSAKTIFLAELISGMALTLNISLSRNALNYPYEKGPLSPRFRGSMHCAAIPVEKNAALPANSVKLCARPAITIEAERDDGSRRTTRYDIDMGRHLLRLLSACPVDELWKGRILNLRRKRGRIAYDVKLLANGDRWETELAARIEADAPTGKPYDYQCLRSSFCQHHGTRCHGTGAQSRIRCFHSGFFIRQVIRAGSRISRYDFGSGLRRRGSSAFHVCGHDARYRRRRTAGGFSSTCRWVALSALFAS